MTEQTMTTIRVKKDVRYFSASNEPFNDKRLSWEARGLMGYLLSKPNDWEVRMSDLENQSNAGSHKLRRILAELRSCGYMNRIRITKGDGKFDWVTEVYESPSQNPRPSGKVIKTSGGKSTSGSSTSGKLPDILSTESLNTEQNENPLSAEELKQVNDKVDAILSFAKRGDFQWKGREIFNDNLVVYADWYFNKTGQIPTQRTKKSWIKAFSEWKSEGLSLDDLEKARLHCIPWKKIISDPNELTKYACAFKAQGSSVVSEHEKTDVNYDANGIPISW